jgi:hypothetical protein
MKVLKKLGVALALAVFAAATSSAALATSTRTGIFEVVITGTIKSNLTAADGSCSVTATTTDVLKNSETMTVPMSISGSTFHCTVTFDYSWVLESTSSTVSLGYTVSAESNTYTTSRTSSALAAAPFAIPASGKTTSFSPKVVL